jgi:hypothetical protein
MVTNFKRRMETLVVYMNAKKAFAANSGASWDKCFCGVAGGLASKAFTVKSYTLGVTNRFCCSLKYFVLSLTVCLLLFRPTHCVVGRSEQ